MQDQTEWTIWESVSIGNMEIACWLNVEKYTTDFSTAIFQMNLG